MANKVLNYSPKQNPSASTTETYKDINMVSKADLKRWVNVNPTYTVGKLVDVNAVRNAIHNIFSWIPGERILDPEFGNKIRQYLYEGITDTTSEQITVEIQHAVKKYEPRAEIDGIQRIDNVQDHENNTIGVNVIWHVVGLPNQKYTETILR